MFDGNNGFDDYEGDSVPVTTKVMIINVENDAISLENRESIDTTKKTEEKRKPMAGVNKVAEVLKAKTSGGHKFESRISGNKKQIGHLLWFMRFFG